MAVRNHVLMAECCSESAERAVTAVTAGRLGLGIHSVVDHGQITDARRFE